MRQASRVLPDIHYVFEMDPNGDLVFLEPFETQKKYHYVLIMTLEIIYMR